VAAKNKHTVQQQQQIPQQQPPQQNSLLQQQRAQIQRMAVATGMSVEQLNAFLNAQKTKLEKMGVTPRQQQAAILEQLNVLVQRHKNAAPPPGDSGSSSTPRLTSTRPDGVQVATPQEDLPAAVQGLAPGLVPASASPNMVTPPADEHVWQKLESMQLRHKTNLERLYPIIKRLSKGQPPDRQETLMKHLKDCFSLLNMRRTPNRPPNLTVELVERVEGFINRVVTVYSKFLKDVASQSNTDPDRRVNAMKQNDQTANHGAGSHARTVPSGPGTTQGPQMSMVEPETPARGMAPQQSSLQHDHAVSVTTQPHQGQNSGPTSRAQQQHAKVQPTGSADPVVSVGTPQSMVQSERNTSSISAQSHAMLQQEQLQRRRVGQRPDGRSEQASVAGDNLPDSQQLRQTEQLHRQQLQQQQAAYGSKTGISKTSRGPVSQADFPAGLSAALQSAHESGNPNNINMVKQQMAQIAIQKNISSSDTAVNTTAALTSGPPMQVPYVGQPRRAEQSLQERVIGMQQAVKTALEQSQRFEARVDSEVKRAKSERIQNTLTALRNSSVLTVSESSEFSNFMQTSNEKRPFSLVDVHNSPGTDDVIKSKTVFECSAEAGLRLAKRPKNETADLKALRDAVEADCHAAKARHENISLEMCTEYGLPVVVCQLLIPEIKLPKLYLRVQRGYPRKGGATYRFERPPLGWVGVLLAVKARFKNAMSIAPAASVGVAAYLDAWAREAEAAVAEAREYDVEDEPAVTGSGADVANLAAAVTA
jgi:hypothetical protein